MSLALFRPKDRSECMPIAYFHALARLSIEGVVIVEPRDVFVSVGYFDDTEAVVDVERCESLGLPLIRREVGGGPVLLGPGQVFYNLVLHKDDLRVPRSILKAYEEFSVPIIKTYRRLGVETEFKAVNDLVVASSKKKISGQGAADIGEMFCFVGAVLNEFNTSLMAQVIKVPDEKFRDKLQKTLEENVTSVKKETGTQKDPTEVERALIEELGAHFDGFEERELPKEVVDLAREIEGELRSDEQLFAPRTRRYNTLRVREGVYFRPGLYKAVGGLIRSKVVVQDRVIREITLSGDFSLSPKAMIVELERAFVGVPFKKSAVIEAAEIAIESNSIDIPGVSAIDLAEAIVGDDQGA